MMEMKSKKQLCTLTILTLVVMLSGCESAPATSTAVTCENPCQSATPKIVFATTEHDFGKVAAGAKKTCSFDFINDGGKDLVIEKIHASCGCTTTTAENTTLRPGQASEIAVTYKAGYSKTGDSYLFPSPLLRDC